MALWRFRRQTIHFQSFGNAALFRSLAVSSAKQNGGFGRRLIRETEPFVYNAIGVPLAAGVLYPFTDLLLSPMIAALAMSLSSASVISNALRRRTAKI